MLRADPGFVRFAPFKQGKAGDPEKFPLGFINDAERFSKLQTKLAGDERGGFCTFDLFFSGNGDDEVASYSAASVGEFFYIFCADEFFNGRGGAFRRELYEISATGAERFCFFGEFVELFARVRRPAG